MGSRMNDVPVLLHGEDLVDGKDAGSLYDSPREISRYLLMHYGQAEDVFGDPAHPLAAAHGYTRRLSEAVHACAVRTGTRVARALDVGCNVGGATHAMSTWVEESVVGVDISARAVETARTLTEHSGGTFGVAESGPFVREVAFRLPPAEGRAAVAFALGDAAALNVPEQPFDAVLLSNVLDRVEDPAACLEQFSASDALLREGGLLAVACPWSWSSAFSRPERWLGSQDGSTTSEEGLKHLLADRFDLLGEGDEPGVLRQNPREYDYFEAHVTVWRKRPSGRRAA
ncbi:class I SAM-dependent methyltransferase [Streptacidiphilus sp. ASG 303]|uniref:class I SAM-dependent methyltransferase n=1 Tax=Streptacidiphilus sp. ASG 303 TaxID=2896847 RepID=UPI001E3CEE95|nr:methyltransferase domain-containing protein [Streptacidiphilus sp. ASG 303]MCD0486353.1 class I SAM-dependent methyltransferase [Streptacidiphilus sp. ASG 303]